MFKETKLQSDNTYRDQNLEITLMIWKVAKKKLQNNFFFKKTHKSLTAWFNNSLDHVEERINRKIKKITQNIAKKNKRENIKEIM